MLQALQSERFDGHFGAGIWASGLEIGKAGDIVLSPQWPQSLEQSGNR
ncbi:hypothetical protein [Xanthomonas citri]|nr:hypothetical protein [Xanthomonas citri]